MKRTAPLLLICCLSFAGLTGLSAEEYEFEKLDFSGARASFAGANWITVRSVKAGDRKLELLIRIESGTAWVIEKITEQETSLWPEDLLLNFTEVTLAGPQAVRLSGLLAGGRFYSADFHIEGGNRLVLQGELKESGLPSSLVLRAEALKSSLVAEERSRFEEEKAHLLLALKKSEDPESDPKIEEAPADPVSRGEAPGLYLESMRSRLSRTVLRGFDGGVPYSGAWKLRNDTVEQVDTTQYFAKLVFPVVQTTDPTLFSFSARAEGEDWVGLGVHIYVKDAGAKEGYGLGRSLLVWLTRDPEAYGNRNTHIQLYSSSSAVSMKRVLDAAIPESITEYNLVEILYDPGTEYVIVAVNGAEKIRYKTWFTISSGAEIALRTLKAKTTFRNLAVSTTE